MEAEAVEAEAAEAQAEAAEAAEAEAAEAEAAEAEAAEEAAVVEAEAVEAEAVEVEAVEVGAEAGQPVAEPVVELVAGRFHPWLCHDQILACVAFCSFVAVEAVVHCCANGEVAWIHLRTQSCNESTQHRSSYVRDH